MNEIVNEIREDINVFTEGAEQFDDITMLCLRYIKNDNN